MAGKILSKSEKAAKKLYVPPEKVDDCIKEREAAEKNTKKKVIRNLISFAC